MCAAFIWYGLNAGQKVCQKGQDKWDKTLEEQGLVCIGKRQALDEGEKVVYQGTWKEEKNQ